MSQWKGITRKNTHICANEATGRAGGEPNTSSAAGGGVPAANEDVPRLPVGSGSGRDGDIAGGSNPRHRGGDDVNRSRRSALKCRGRASTGDPDATAQAANSRPRLDGHMAPAAPRSDASCGTPLDGHVTTDRWARDGGSHEFSVGNMVTSTKEQAPCLVRRVQGVTRDELSRSSSTDGGRARKDVDTTGVPGQRTPRGQLRLA